MMTVLIVFLCASGQCKTFADTEAVRVGDMVSQEMCELVEKDLQKNMPVSRGVFGCFTPEQARRLEAK